jgi:hypothetical protein
MTRESELNKGECGAGTLNWTKTRLWNWKSTIGSRRILHVVKRSGMCEDGLFWGEMWGRVE